MSIKKRALKVFAIVLAVVALVVSGVTLAFAADQGPVSDKSLTPNDDGTYTIELSVTGDADETPTTVGKANILVVFDTSDSMITNLAGTGDGIYRSDAAEGIISDFATQLFAYNTTPTSENIQMALVTFNRTADPLVSWTNKAADITTVLGDGTAGSHQLDYDHGTNWDSAMAAAKNMLDNADTDPTFVIFLTDGLPSLAGENPGTNYANLNADGTDPNNAVLNCAVAAMDDAETIAARANTTLYGIYAYGSGYDYLDDVLYDALNGERRTESTAIDTNGVADNYFNATDTGAIQSAINKVFSQIVSVLGIEQVGFEDGTTKDVTVGAETVNLLDIDEDSYKYWLSIPVDSSNQFKLVDRDTGDTVTYTVSSDGSKITWGDGNSVTVENGTLSGGVFKFQWTEATDFYNVNPPEAKLNGSTVEWDLKDAGVLLNGVTYSVTFDCWPSQTTLDYIADIENGMYDTLPAEVQEYITPEGKLKTNTTCTLNYVDSRTGESGSTTVPNPDPVSATAVEQMAVAKKWENELDPSQQQAQDIILSVTRDGDPTYELDLKSTNNWEDNVFISIGIMRHVDDGDLTDSAGKKYEVLASGHDFTFTEPENMSYHWELDVPTVRPMMIDGTVTMLILKGDAPYDNADGDTEYEINGSTYYVGKTGEASLTAINHRRSSLLFTKVVEGENVPEDATFPFTFNVVNSNAENGKDGDTSTDAYVWISVRDKDNKPVNEGVTGATAENGTNGWYYAKSGDDITVDVKPGYSIRINNLPTGSTYTITEGDLDPVYAFVSSELSIEDGDGADSTFAGDQVTTGTIEDYNTLYKVTYTNSYGAIDIPVEKVWEDGNDADGIRPESITVVLLANNEETDFMLELSDENDWAGTFEALPTMIDNEEVEYTVKELEVEGYEVAIEGDAENGFTITNTHASDIVISDPPVEKILKGDKPEKDATFKFQMKAITEGAPMPEGATDGVITTEIVGSGSKEFGEMTFTEPGTYEYELTEIDTGEDGYTYDKTAYTLTVVVEADENGKLTKTETVVDNEGNEVEKATFTNTYTAPKQDNPPATPKTGDATPMAAIQLMMGFAAATLVGSSVLRTRTRED